ncbi:hypothetical protein TNCV_1266201 [Trichonephila clavipes]|nr:hypothetical protein TNCV_1266201 [Trichonephila clavipes]
MSTTSHQIGQSDKYSALKKTRGGKETSAIGENSICSTFSCRTCAEYSVASSLPKAKHSAWLKGFRFRLEETDLRLELCYSNRDVTVKDIRPAGVESKESKKKKKKKKKWIAETRHRKVERNVRCDLTLGRGESY